MQLSLVELELESSPPLELVEHHSLQLEHWGHHSQQLELMALHTLPEVDKLELDQPGELRMTQLELPLEHRWC